MDYEAAALIWSIILPFIWFTITFSLIVAILQIVGTWKTFSKANQPGWAALIPFYNTYVACKLSGVNPWWILIVLLSPILCIVPIIGALAAFAVQIYFVILLNVSISRAFGKSDAFAIGLILLAPVFFMILGFDKSTYVGAKPMEDLLFDKMLK